MKKIEFFFLGISAAIIALFLEASAYVLFFMPDILKSSPNTEIVFPLSFLLASAFIEELIKNLVIYKKIDYLLSSFRIALSAFFLGLGFSITEITLLYFKLGDQLFNSLFLIGGIIIVHIITAVSAGYFFSTKKEHDYISLCEIIIITTIMHFAYNYFIYLF